MRYRTRGIQAIDGSFTVPGGCFAYGGTPLCPSTPVTVSLDSSVWHASMVDDTTEHFESKSKAGQLFFHPMYLESYYMTQTPTRVYYSFAQSGKLFYNSVGTLCSGTVDQLLTSTDTSAVDTKLAPFQGERDVAITRAWANVDESEMMALASLGELPETIRFVASLMTRMIKVMALFKARKLKLYAKRQFMSRKAFTDALANFWLEMRYAVRPLAFEMQQLVDAIEASEKPPRRTARGFNSVVENVSDTSYDKSAGTTNHCTERCIVTRRSNYRAGVLYSVSLDDLGFKTIFGFDQPLEAVWELTRLSFVLDWFLNVGDLIASWTPNANLTPLGSWCTEEHRWTYVYQHSDMHYTGTWTAQILSAGYGNKEVTYWLKRRVISPDKPVFPRIAVNLNVAKLVDLLAIARSIYRGLMR